MIEKLAIAVLTLIVTVVVEEFRHRRASELQRKAQHVAKQLLESDKWPKRSFDSIKARLGGFGDDELRKILVSVGAVRFKGEDGKELWGLLSRNRA